MNRSELIEALCATEIECKLDKIHSNMQNTDKYIEKYQRGIEEYRKLYKMFVLAERAGIKTECDPDWRYNSTAVKLLDGLKLTIIFDYSSFNVVLERIGVICTEPIIDLDAVNYHALKGMACIYAKSRDTFGWLTCSLLKQDVPA